MHSYNPWSPATELNLHSAFAVQYAKSHALIISLERVAARDKSDVK
jgi:hypothetical protein